jgi:hypothetical protein
MQGMTSGRMRRERYGGRSGRPIRSPKEIIRNSISASARPRRRSRTQPKVVMPWKISPAARMKRTHGCMIVRAMMVRNTEP